MPFTADVLARIEATLPPADVTMARLQDYITRTDMSKAQLAKMIGYSASSIANFLSGDYSKYTVKTDIVIRRALEDFMDRHPIGLPETMVTGELYETENVAELRRWFDYCHGSRALAFCYGPPGSQKSFTLKHLVCEFNRRELAAEKQRNLAYYVYVSVRMQPRDLLVKMCEQAGAAIGATLQRCMRGLRHQLSGANAVFVMDEAQHLSIDCLEILRELHDESPRIGALLAGSHELKKLFDRRAAELEQWNSRLHAGIELAGVSEDRARQIISTELPSLSDKQVSRLIEGARTTDAYSSKHPTYLNVRRLFNNVAATRTALAARQEVVQ